MRKLLITAAIAFPGAMLAGQPGRAEPAPFMMQATVAGRLVEGQPLAWTDRQMLLLGRDGVLHDFDPTAAVDAKKVGGAFVGYSIEEMQARLRAEFDRNCDIISTAHFVVVHPRGAAKDWADRLESLYRSFTHYVSIRGFQPTAPAVPLVAVVFPNQQQYYANAAAAGLVLPAGTMGHYDPATNRMHLYDAAKSGGDWSVNAETIIHEATHQTAYNVGVHRRFAEQPRWAVEGLAMIFEARGVWDARTNSPQAERINRERLQYFRGSADARGADWLTRLVAGDASFESAPLRAYAEAWVLTFYLCETRPQEYCGYLGRVADRQPFTAYPPQARLADFAAAFGSDLELLAAQLQRFVETLP
jgi:hypothetical protein